MTLTIKRSKESERAKAFTSEEVHRLLHAACGWSGTYRPGIPRSAFWRALVRLGWDTGLRISDLLAIRFADLCWTNQTISFVEEKTNRAITCKLSDATMQAVAAIREPHRELILPWFVRLEMFYRAFRALAERAGVDGTTKFFRSGDASTTVQCGVSP